MLLTCHRSSHEVASFFEPSISAIVEAIRRQKTASSRVVTVSLDL